MLTRVKNGFQKTLILTIALTLLVATMGAMIPALAESSAPEWQANKVYWGGDVVTHNGKLYEAKWWTLGDRPDKEVAYPWDTPWQLKEGGSNPTPQPTVDPTPEPTTPPDPTPQPTADPNPTPQPTTDPTPDNVIYPDYSSVDVGQGIDWPKAIFAPFVDATAWPTQQIADKTKAIEVPYYNLGFVVSQSREVCKPTWGTYYSGEAGPMNDQIKKLRAMGGDVIVSFGGAANVPLHVAAPDATSLKEQYKRFIKAYGLTRVDFDIEGAWVNDTTSLTRNAKALKMLQDELKAESYNLEVWLTLPVLPSGLVPSGVNVLKLHLDEGVEIAGINIMTMDYGDSVAPNPDGQMGEYGIQALENLHRQMKAEYQAHGIQKTDAELWSMTGTTPMIGMNDVTTEIFYQQDAKETLAFAKEKGVGMISMWSLNRDKSPNGKLNYVTIDASSIVQQPDEFSTIFNDYNDTSVLDTSAGGGTDPGTPGEPSTGTWSASKVYVGGDQVTYNGHTYEAKWWNQNDVPDKPVSNPWETPWKLVK